MRVAAATAVGAVVFGTGSVFSGFCVGVGGGFGCGPRLIRVEVMGPRRKGEVILYAAPRGRFVAPPAFACALLA